ncbi:MAG: right-handed parallel beta-helix repeat-containing protein [bacterium]
MKKTHLPIIVALMACFLAGTDCPAWSKIIYVNTQAAGNANGADWANAFTRIAPAVVAAGINDEIWVARGRYPEAVLMKSGTALYGGFAGTESLREQRNWKGNETILDGGGLANSTVVTAEDTVLDGFTVTGGSNRGVWCKMATFQMAHCLITGNREYGLFISDSCKPSVTDCEISNNGRGVMCANRSAPTLILCVIRDNRTKSSGGGVVCESRSTPALISCVITGNTAGEAGGGMYVTSVASPQITQCMIAGNIAGVSGGGVFCGLGALPKLENCAIVGNRARDTGGVYAADSYPTLIHCTIAGNTMGGFFATIKSRLTLKNCIVWNPGTEITGDSLHRYENDLILFSCVQGGWPGRGNIGYYPQFKDPPNGDFRLLNGSPCIDSASPEARAMVDLDGRPRPGEDGWVDMGAYESPPEYRPVTVPAPRTLYVRSTADPGGDGSSWDQAMDTIGMALFVTNASDEIWVAGGTYRESIWLEPNVALYGGFAGLETSRESRNRSANETIIDATGLHTMASVTGAGGALLDSFTVTGGEACGVYCDGTFLSLTDCVITGNSTYVEGWCGPAG